MNLKPRKETIYGQKEFMRNTVGMEYKTGGVTLDGAAFPEGYVKAGTAVFRSGNGLYHPVAADTTAAAIVAGVLTTDDVRVYGDDNVIVGGIMAGHPDPDKVTGVTAAFRTATAGRLHFDL